MSDPGHGKPVDPLDNVCKEYKDCLKCARMAHGETCIGEFVKYRYINNGPDNVKCRDNPNRGGDYPCKRALCECDLAFARAHPNVNHHFNTDYHLFWSTTGWDEKDEGNCVRNPGGPHLPKCCGTPKTAYRLYNAHPNAKNAKKCCNGEVKDTCDA